MATMDNFHSQRVGSWSVHLGMWGKRGTGGRHSGLGGKGLNEDIVMP